MVRKKIQCPSRSANGGAFSHRFQGRYCPCPPCLCQPWRLYPCAQPRLSGLSGLNPFRRWNSLLLNPPEGEWLSAEPFGNSKGSRKKGEASFHQLPEQSHVCHSREVFFRRGGILCSPI